MHAAKTPPTDPSACSAADGDALPEKDARHTLTLRSALALCLASFGVMAPWPLLGILLLRGSLDHWNEACLLFGGLTAFPLALLALLGVSETVWVSMLMYAWIATVIAPVVWLTRRPKSWRTIVTVMVFQSAFSLAQALLGALMILGKNV